MASSGALGLGIIASASFLLGLLHTLRPAAIALLLILTIALLSHTVLKAIRENVPFYSRWFTRPIHFQPSQLFLAGAILGSYWLNLLGALTPETLSDSVRQRLPTAIQFAHYGDLKLHDPELIIASSPSFAEMTYAFFIAISSLQSAKFVHFYIGMLCTAAVFALGQQLGGRRAAYLSAFSFSTTIITAYLAQSSYIDLFTVMFAVVAVVVLVGDRSARTRPLILSGSFLGFGIATKLHFGYVAIGIIVLAGVLALNTGSISRAVRDVMIVGVTAALVASPWLIRSLLLTGQVPGLSLTAQALAPGSDDKTRPLFDLVTFGYGRSLSDFLALPFTVTFTSLKFGGAALFPGVFGGHIGFLLLALVPLCFFSGRKFHTLAVALGMLVATALWFYSAQYLRYGLPLIAVMCALAGVGYRNASRYASNKNSRTVVNILVTSIAICGLFARAQNPDISRTYAFGMETRDNFLEQNLVVAGAGNYQLLQILDTAPDVTRVFALPDGARLYTRARISGPLTTESGRKFIGGDEAILRMLAADGYSHILIDRQGWPGPLLGWDNLPLVDEEFLRRNTEIVAGGNQKYLYRIIYPANRTPSRGWTNGSELLRDDAATWFANWKLNGETIRESNTNVSNAGMRAITLTSGDALAVNISLEGNKQYLLSSTIRGVEGYGTVRVQIGWYNRDGALLQTSVETLPTSPNGNHTISILASAPDQAQTAQVVLLATGGTTSVTSISLHEAITDH